MPTSEDVSVEDQFTAYVTARQAALLRTAYMLTGDQHGAEDLLQTALAKTFLSWNKIRDHHAIDSYVRRIMVNEYTSWWRRAWRKNEITTDELPERPRGAAAAGPDHEQADAMWRLVGTLPPRQRAALVLRYYEDLSEAETAQVLGCSVGNVKSQTSRALASLRQRMGAETGAAMGGAW